MEQTAAQMPPKGSTSGFLQVMPQSIDYIEKDDTMNWEFDQSICNDLQKFLTSDQAEGGIPAEALRKSRITYHQQQPSPPRNQRHMPERKPEKPKMDE